MAVQVMVGHHVLFYGNRDVIYSGNSGKLL